MSKKFMTRAQTNYIQGHLKLRGEDTVTLAKKLHLPWSTVASAINGHRANAAARQAIADFLGEPVEKLFGDPQATNEGPQVEKEGPQVENLGHRDEAAHG